MKKSISQGKFERVASNRKANMVMFSPKRGGYVITSSIQAWATAKRMKEMSGIGDLQRGTNIFDKVNWYHFVKYELDGFLYFQEGGKFWRRQLRPVTMWEMKR